MKKKTNKTSPNRITFRKVASSIIIVCLSLFITFLRPSIAGAYYYDLEDSRGNVFSTGLLDFYLTDDSDRELVGKKLLGGQEVSVTPVPEEGSMAMQYKVSATSTTPTCSEFMVHTRFDGPVISNTAVPLVALDATTTFATLEFEFRLPLNADVTHGDLCEADIIFDAWRADTELQEESGYFDTEVFSLTLKAKTISLNEILADPDSADPAPANREFIELYNSGNAPVDIAGWEISEISGDDEKFYPITADSASGTDAYVVGGDTVVPVDGYAVLAFNGNTGKLNNDGDTVRLYDADGDLLDEYAYTSSTKGKSDARMPNGFGPWVDPIPTPGFPNVLEEEEILTVLLEEEVVELVVEEDLINEEVEEEVKESEESLEDEKDPLPSDGGSGVVPDEEAKEEEETQDEVLKKEDGDEDPEESKVEEEGDETVGESEESTTDTDEVKEVPDEEVKEVPVVEVEEEKAEEVTEEPEKDEEPKDDPEPAPAPAEEPSSAEGGSTE